MNEDLKSKNPDLQMLSFDVQFGDLENSERSAFVGSVAKREVLGAHTSLYRFCENDYLSPWWTETKYLPGLLFGGLVSKKPFYHFIRDTSAVLRGFKNAMTHLVVASLNEDVIAFKGGISPQNEAAIYMNKNSEHYKKRFTKPILFGGGNQQVYINGFKRPANNETDETKKKERAKEINEEMSRIQKRYLTYQVPFGAILTYDKIEDIIEACKFCNII